MGGKKGSSEVKSAPTTVEGQQYWDMYPDVAQSGLNPYYHYLTYGQAEGRTYGSPAEGGGGLGFAMPEFAMPAIPDYAAMQAEAQAKAEAKQASQKVDDLYRSKFSAAHSAIDKVDAQLAEEMSYAKVGGADYSYTPEQRKERINNVFATLWGEEDESRLSSLEKQYGSGSNKWTLDIVRGVDKGTEGALDKDAKSAGSAVDPTKVLSRLLGGGATEEDDEKLGGVLGTIGG